MDKSMTTELVRGVYLVDSGMVRIGLAACYVIERGGRVAIVETGTRYSVPGILSVMSQLGLQTEQVDYIIATHVHLDHAGGVGLLMQELPEAQLVIHPRGARHMIDPAKLQAGATAVYGEEAFQEMYGDLIPVDEARIVIAEDRDVLKLGGSTLEFLDTPGHASHHFCVWDEASNGFFTGDTFGIAYRELVVDGKPLIFPTTTPVQFDPEALKSSIQKLMSKQPERMFLTHYGMVENPAVLAPQLLEQIDDYVQLVDESEGIADDAESLHEAIHTRITDYTLARAIAHGCDRELAAETIEFDMGLNAQGLALWSQRRSAANQ
ncbi:MBL fold metallo-hydrolase [Pseudomaricurvus sp.]|uniref:MBL fold metallo-hydrolase n=1 Tax=Pseudomaricurvus sp. TaxID=2004510 RepID=UPI003F6BBE41